MASRVHFLNLLMCIGTSQVMEFSLAFKVFAYLLGWS